MAIGATFQMRTHQEDNCNSSMKKDYNKSNQPQPSLLDDHENDMVMPGFRFHPTEEELIEFYLRRKVEGKRFNVELITLLDLYRFDPWELPALAAIGEKEWYFYVPRDKKYRNGDRPNRVTTSGYWKATGADRMIRSENSRSIGIKKTLVFYTGKAPKGVRTGWIMNEYRLPVHETERLQKAEISLCRVHKRAGIEDHQAIPRSLHKLKVSQPLKNGTHSSSQYGAKCLNTEGRISETSRSSSNPLSCLGEDDETLNFLQFKQPAAYSSPTAIDDLHKLVNGFSHTNQQSMISNPQISSEGCPPINLVSFFTESQQQPPEPATGITPGSSLLTFPWDWNTIHEGNKDYTTLFK